MGLHWLVCSRRDTHVPSQRSTLDVAAFTTCALIWGTSWHAIKLQLGTVDPLVSVVYRFGLAALLLFGWCALSKQSLALSARQHQAALGMGLCMFAIDYGCVYEAEVRVASAVVAMVFAATPFFNLLGFRLLAAQRAPSTACLAALLGAAGVGLLSWGEIVRGAVDVRALDGIALALLAVFGTVGGNLFALRGERAGARLLPSTAWSMAYGVGLLALFDLISGRVWRLPLTPGYLGSLLYLSIPGSVLAYLFYFSLARRRGYTLAAYISALTPLIAMLMSSLYEGKRWGSFALTGVVLVLAGQWLLLRPRRQAEGDTPSPWRRRQLAGRDA